jgi:hypothetical protein
MANPETQILDEVIVKSRRRMLTLGGTALAGMLFADTGSARAQSATYTDADILNFALNLEYLEANFYYLAAFGTTIDVSNAASTAAGALKLGITGVGTQGTVTVKSNPKVNFGSNIAVASYCNETAVEEGKHVNFLRTALGSAAVAQPAIDLQTSFNTLASAAGVASTFDPFASDVFFLVGAYIFEDVGVTAYHGAAPLISQTSAGKANLQAAAGILAVEAYHAGLVRTTIFATDAANGNSTLTGYTTAISALRAKLALAVASATANPYDTNPDDYGVAPFTTPIALGGGSTATVARITDADSTNAIAFSRTTSQVLNIVTGGGAGTAASPVTPAKGVFFPSGLNGLFK